MSHLLPHPGHPEWVDLSMELLCYRSFEAVESAALMVLHTLSIHQEMLKTLLGLVPTMNPNDPVWLGRMANIATLLEIVPPYDAVQTLARCDNPPRKIPYYRLRPIHFGH
jgi:hypothetical protein